MFGWGKNKNKKAAKQRSAPQAHRHPAYKPNAPRPPIVSAQLNRRSQEPQSSKNSNNKSQSQPQSQSQTQIQSPRRPQSNPLKQNHSAPSNPNDDDEDEDESDDMFADMEMNDDDEDDDQPTTESPKKPQTRQRTMSVEALNRLSEEERLTMALQMSMGTPSINAQPNKANNVASLTQTIKEKQATPPTQLQPAVDKANIEWPDIPNTKEQLVANLHVKPVDNTSDHNNHNNNNTESSAFGFDLSGTVNNGDHNHDNDNDNNDTNQAQTTSAFGFDLSGNNANVNAHDDNKQNAVEEEEDIFAITRNAEDGNISTANNYSTAHTSTQLTGSPSPSNSISLAPVDNSVLSQLKRAEQQHQRSRKRIWSQIKQCLEREQRIKERESELRAKLILENQKKMQAEHNKFSALKNADFELAEKSKNIIRRSLKNIQDVNHQLRKYEGDILKIHKDKTSEEGKYQSKNVSYREKLKLLYDKHEENMSKNIEEEFGRIERAEKKFKEKLDRTQREIQLDDENIEKCKEKMEEIEDLIKTDVEPYQDNLDGKNNEKACLLLEIDELNKQLLHKQKELASIEGNISELNNEVVKVRKIYSQQMDEINEQQSRYEESKNKFNLQKNEFVLKLNGLNDDNIKNKQNEQEFDDELNSLKLKISKINDSFERFEEKKQRHTQWRNEEHRLLESEKVLNKKLDEISYSIEKYEKELKQIDSKCIQHRSTMSTVDSALPILHSDKTSAVNNENYLEAGKIHKQILHKTQLKEKSMEQLKVLNDKTFKIKEKYAGEQALHSQIKHDLSDIKIKIHKQRFDLMIDERDIIRDSLQSMNHDKEDDVEHIVLNMELNQFEVELEYFMQEYGWNMEQTKRDLQHSEDLDDVLSNNAEEEEEECAAVAVPVAVSRNKSEIETEIMHLNEDILQKEKLKEEIQNEINLAVANDAFEEAGKLAPKKKKLLAEINESKAVLDGLNEDLVQREKEEMNEVSDEIMDGYNAITDEHENEQLEHGNGAEIHGIENRENVNIINEANSSNDDVVVVDKSDENNKEEQEDVVVVVEGDEHENEEDMFGDMSVNESDDDDQDTVNID